MKDFLIAAGMGAFRATRAHKLLDPLTGGLGAILMFHNVRPFAGGAFAPNRLLEITPEFLEETLRVLRTRGYDIIAIDEVPRRLAAPNGRRFAALTFDDGYRDNLEIAAPILRRHGAPYTIYVTTGFAERTARLWWLEIEAALARLEHVEIALPRETLATPARSVAEKRRAFARLTTFLRRQPEEEMRAAVLQLLERAGVDPDFAPRLCMDWGEIAQAAQDPLCTIGVHTLTHARLSLCDPQSLRAELAESRSIIEARLGRPARHLAYPFGDPGSAGAREFAMARELGFETAVTTRPGVLYAGQAAHPTALPRLSVNGNWQEPRDLEALLSGAAFALWNLGRRVQAA